LFFFYVFLSLSLLANFLCSEKLSVQRKQADSSTSSEIARERNEEIVRRGKRRLGEEKQRSPCERCYWSLAAAVVKGKDRTSFWKKKATSQRERHHRSKTTTYLPTYLPTYPPTQPIPPLRKRGKRKEKKRKEIAHATAIITAFAACLSFNAN
jgi:hypothetical protein